MSFPANAPLTELSCFRGSSLICRERALRLVYHHHHHLLLLLLLLCLRLVGLTASMSSRLNGMRRGGGSGEGNGLVAVGIDKDKGSQHALRWAVENLLSRGQTVVLIHVLHKTLPGQGQVQDITSPALRKESMDKQTKDLFLTFRCYCTRKEIQCHDVILEHHDVVKAITEYLSHSAIENLVLGAPSRSGFIRKFRADIPSSISKVAPDFCTVYVISKGKISSTRNASRAAPQTSPLLEEIKNKQSAVTSDPSSKKSMVLRDRIKPRTSFEGSAKSNASRDKGYIGKPFSNFGETDCNSDISFISSGRPSTDRSSCFDFTDTQSRLSTSTDHSFGSIPMGLKWDQSSPFDNGFSSTSDNSGGNSSVSQIDDVEAEMRRLKLELKQTMDMYNTACKEALVAKQQAQELRGLKDDDNENDDDDDDDEEEEEEEEHKAGKEKNPEEAEISVAEKERIKMQTAMEAAEAANKIAKLEAKRKINVETKKLEESDEMKRIMGTLGQDIRYRRYKIEDIEKATNRFSDSQKIGEGGYGPVFKCNLDHTSTAVKVLRPDAAQGRSQFHNEIEVLSCIRHPHMVLLLGACPEYGILVYEYMANGSLEDRLMRKGNTPPLSWQLRFRIAAEIASGLLFLHQAKPEPFVHRDLKPGNILLDQNYVSKISDVGLARLVPAVAENVTQCRVTSTAGTFCYIDPEYQSTGMLGVKSDIYSMGIMLLQIITARPPMGLAHYMEQAIDAGRFTEMLDPTVPDWPVDEALAFAKLAMQCSELRRKDRPDLANEILPELSRLREFAEQRIPQPLLVGGGKPPPPLPS